jgi:hypothetical protein
VKEVDRSRWLDLCCYSEDDGLKILDTKGAFVDKLTGMMGLETCWDHRHWPAVLVAALKELYDVVIIWVSSAEFIVLNPQNVLEVGIEVEDCNKRARHN